MAQERKIREIVAEQLGIHEEDIQDDASFRDHLGADSLDLLEVIMAIEEEFEVEISENDAENLDTVTKLARYLTGNVQ